ncbi:hypothetical protein [Sphingomonas sp. TX0522]|uniref:hypothetical protein n=1 Tax=Sphingomonas sp. TX0522 TaxID=2479205 RepID=UPI0018E01A04|nr:hypothetical protein [Sphingomonas sp. TX0522]MBI0530086.1 hypothetical protein [Sphingomonas sp. TX0522]
MVAAVAPRNTPLVTTGTVARDVAAATKILAGTIVALSAAGFAVPASTALGLIADGRAEETVDNTSGAAGDLKVLVRKGTFRFANSAAGDLVGRTEIGKTVYLVDNQTVAKTDGGGTRSPAGKVFDVDATGVWVTF